MAGGRGEEEVAGGGEGKEKGKRAEEKVATTQANIHRCRFDCGTLLYLIKYFHHQKNYKYNLRLNNKSGKILVAVSPENTIQTKNDNN